MKALISPTEIKTIQYISGWVMVDNEWTPAYNSIENCQRIAEVKPDDNSFDVAPPLYWIDCPENCRPESWYYKDGVYEIPPDAPFPENPIE
jgi:hypothetical protein